MTKGVPGWDHDVTRANGEFHNDERVQSWGPRSIGLIGFFFCVLFIPSLQQVAHGVSTGVCMPPTRLSGFEDTDTILLDSVSSMSST